MENGKKRKIIDIVVTAIVSVLTTLFGVNII